MVAPSEDFVKRWQSDFRVGGYALHWDGDRLNASFEIADRKIAKATGRKALADKSGNLYPLEECTHLIETGKPSAPISEAEVADVIEMIALAKDDDECAIAVEEALATAYPTYELKKQLWAQLPQESRQLLYYYREVAKAARGEVAA